MSNHELESKVRELRQLQALIEEAQTEAETIKDQLKAHMGAADELRAGEYKVRQNRRHGAQGGPARGGGAVHPDHHHPPLLRGMRKAPYPPPAS